MPDRYLTQDTEGGMGRRAVPPDRKATAITTAGNGTLTADAMVGGYVVRTGPTGAYTDTTATAAQIIAAFPGCRAGDTFEFTHLNGVAFACTLAAGTGVTLAGTTANAASKVRTYLVTITSIDTPAVTVRGIGELVA